MSTLAAVLFAALVALPGGAPDEPVAKDAPPAKAPASGEAAATDGAKAALLPGIAVTKLAFCSSKKLIAAASPSGGLHVSLDGGATFTKTGFPLVETGKIPDVIEDLDVLCDGSKVSIGIISSLGGVFLSTNGGKSFDRIDPKDEEGAFETVGLAKGILLKGKASAPTILLAVKAMGVLRSTDKGKTWETVAPSLDIGTAIDGSGKEILAGGYKSMMAQSSDGGKSWGLIKLPTFGIGVLTITMVGDDGLVYLTTNLKDHVYRSTNKGMTLQDITPLSAVTFPSLGVKPGQPDTIAIVNGGAVMVSKDGGEEYQTIPGIGNASVVGYDASGTLWIGTDAGLVKAP